MISAIMLYGTAIAAFFAFAAFAAERAVSVLGLPRRGVWALALLCSIAAPPAMMMGIDRPPNRALAAPSGISAPDTAGELASAASLQRMVQSATGQTSTSLTVPKLDSMLALMWGLASAGLIGFYVAGAMHTRRRLRGDRSGTIAGHEVVLSDDIGPAVLGFVKPTVIVPTWLLHAPLLVQSLVLEHERQHVKARDQWLLVLGLIAVVIAPWNLPLWWQLRRLRFAIEVDCDARVIGKGADALTYGEVLLQVGRQSLRSPMMVVALIEPPSDLERRIVIMTNDRHRHAAMVATACTALCASLVVGAAQIEPPRVDRQELRLPPARAELSEYIQAIVRERYPELFAVPLAQPVHVQLVLNNDLSIEWAQKTELPAQTTEPTKEALELPKGRLQADEPRFMSQIQMLMGSESKPVYVSSAIHMFHPSRSPTNVERGLKAKFPELYDDSSDSDVLLIALMKDDGTVERALQRPRVAGESLIGQENQMRALAPLNVKAAELAIVEMIPNGTVSPFRPLVLYAFRKSEDPALDADPTRPVDHTNRFAIQRALIERHFPEIAHGSTNPHALLWVLLDQSGNVVATGREATSPEPLMVNLERQYPGAATAQRTTTQLTALFGKEMRDVAGEPILVTFAWLADGVTQRPRAASSAQSIAIDLSLYRNGKLVSSGPLTLKVGVPQVHNADRLRLDLTAMEVGGDLIDLGIVMRVPVERPDAEFADRWEVVSQPMIRTKFGSEAVIEQGVRYPGKEGDVLWRAALTPRRSI